MESSYNQGNRLATHSTQSTLAPITYHQGDGDQHRVSGMREIVHIQAGQCGNQIGAKVKFYSPSISLFLSVSLPSLSFSLSLSISVSLS